MQCSGVAFSLHRLSLLRLLSLLTVQVLSFAVLSREDATSRDGEADDSEIQDARYGAAALPSLTAAESRAHFHDESHEPLKLCLWE